MRNADERGGPYLEDNSDADSISSDRTVRFSGPLTMSGKRSSKKSARFNIPAEEEYVEITLDIRDDTVAVHSVQEDPELALLARKTDTLVESKASSLRSSLKQALSSRPSGEKRLGRTQSATAHALRGLKFIASKTERWPAVERRFNELTASTGGLLLHRSLFGECIGMNRESKDFAGELFRVLALRHNVEGDSISKTQLKQLWDHISDDTFDSRLQTFFDMVDKDADGRITEEEVAEVTPRV